MIVKKEKDEIQNYLEDASNLKGGEVEKVFIPENEEEVKEILCQCTKDKMPLTISGGGTGVVGGRLAPGGAVLSTERLNKILEINERQRCAILQSGVIIEDFLKALAEKDLFYPPFPTERTAFIGGNISTNASGEYSLKFGCTREYVKGIKIALSSGEIISLKRGEFFARDGYLEIPSTQIKFKIPSYKMPALRKNAAGYYAGDNMDLIDLFIGSEGTLAVILEAEVRLVAKLKENFFSMLFFKNFAQSSSFIKEIKEKEVLAKNLLCLEYLDKHSLNLIRPFYPHIPSQVEECIMIGLENPESVLEAWEEILEKYPPVDDWMATTEKQKEEFYQFRHKLPEVINETIKRNRQSKISTDIVVPENNFWEMLDFYRDTLKNCGMEYVIFGHIGECHLHVNLLVRNEKERQAAIELYREFVKNAVRLGGSISGEHGIGKRKHEYLKMMYAEDGIKEMARIKKAIDPACILGLDNIFPRHYLH